MSSRLRTAIVSAYRLIGDATPIPADCGKLCGGACCKGEEEDGMLLFPGEMVHLSAVEAFRIFRIRYMDTRVWLLTCNGTCNRETRPLSCRIFPLAPYVDAQGKVSALPDPRAARMCPLADGKFLDPTFVRGVEKAFRLLSAEPKIMDFMELISSELEELRKLAGIL